MYKTTFFILFFVAFIFTGARGQESKKWSLSDCIEYAKENNLGIRQQELNTEYQGNMHQQAKRDRTPSLNGSMGYQMSFGRVPDETSYEFQTQTTQFGRFSVGSSVPLFRGFTMQNEVKQGKAEWEMAKNELEAARNDLALNITAYYLQVLFDKELLEVAREQYQVAQEQVENTQKLVQSGRVAEGNLLEIKSQASREALNVTRMENNLSLSLLNLAQSLDLKETDNFDVVVPDLPEIEGEELLAPGDLFNTAIDIMPRIEASRYNLQSSEYAFNAAKGNLYPSLMMEAGWSTNVSKSKRDTDFDFSQRFRDNANEYIGLSLRIPIFNGLSARNNVTNARLGIRRAQTRLEQEEQGLRKEIQQAYADAEAAFQKYQAAQTAVEAYTESLRYTEKKYSVGMVNTVDYSVARSEYIKAQSDFLQSKYEYVLRTRILDFYRGEPLALEK